jgi:4-hydroxy-tetrahydrodipicolinate reductase
VLTTIQRQLTALTIDEYADLSKRDSPELLFDLMGFGRPAGTFEQFRADYLRSSFGPSLRLVATRSGCRSTRWTPAESWRWPVARQ